MFERKLKMMRTNLYGMLAVCQCRELFDHDLNVAKMKVGIRKLLERDD